MYINTVYVFIYIRFTMNPPKYIHTYIHRFKSNKTWERNVKNYKVLIKSNIHLNKWTHILCSWIGELYT